MTTDNNLLKTSNKSYLYPAINSTQTVAHLSHVCVWTHAYVSMTMCCHCSVAQSCPTLCDPMDCSMPGFPVLHHLQSLLRLISIESMMPSNQLVLSCPLLLCLQSFSASGSFLKSWLFESGGQNIGVSVSSSVLPMNIQDWFPLGLTGLISLQSKGLSSIFSNITVQFSRSVMSDSLRPHEPQHARPPCTSPTPWVYSNPCPLRQWYHPAISSSVIPFSSCPQPFPASGSFQMSQLFTSDGQSTGVSASKSVLPMNTQDWSPLGWTGWISLQSKGPLRDFSNTTVQKHQFFSAQLSL